MCLRLQIYFKLSVHLHATANTALVRAAARALTASLFRKVTPLMQATSGPGLSTTFFFVLENPLYLQAAQNISSLECTGTYRIGTDLH